LTNCEGAGRWALIEDGVEALTLVISKGCGTAILKSRGCRDRFQKAGECGSDNAFEQGVKIWFLQSSATREFGPTIICGNEATVHVASADTEFNHDRGVRCVGKIECFFHQIDYCW